MSSSAKTTWVAALLTLILALGLPALVWSQAASGSIAGYVYDPTGAVIPDAEVQATNTATGQVRTVRSDASGRYVLAQLPVGSYEIRVRREGFADLRRTNITLEVGAELEINTTLQLAGVQEEIVVTEATPLIEPSKTGGTSVIVESEIRELPVNNRNWTELALLTPGVNVDAEFDSVASVSINGQEGVFNNVQVDGVDNNNAFFAEVRGRTRAPFQFSQETVKEFRVMNTAYSAEHGRAAGGVINAVTKSGTNDYHGSVFYYLRDDAFNATPFFNNAAGLPKPDTRRQQFGGTVGGPISRDKAFFFFSYDQQDHRDPATIVFDPSTDQDLTTNPLDFLTSGSVSTGSNSFLNAVDGTGSRTIDLTNGNDTLFGTFTEADLVHQAYLNWAFARAYFLGDTSFLDQTVITPFGTIQSTNPFPGRSFTSVERIVPRNRDQVTFFPKVTVLLNDNHTLNLQYNFQDFEAGPNGIFTNPSKTDNGDGTEKNRSDSFNAGVSSVFSPTLLNEFRFQFSRDDAETDSTNPGVPEIDIFSFDIGSQGFVPRFTFEDRWQFRDDFSLIKGRHSIKFGADFLITKDDNFFPGDFNGQYSFLGPGMWIDLSRSIGGRDYFGIDLATLDGPAAPGGRFDLNNYQQRFGGTTTTQDTVDYGLYVQDNIRLTPHWVLNLGLRYEFQKLEDPVLPNPLVPQTARINEDENNFAPRIGLAWSPRENLVVRAGYGLFYIRTGQLDVDNAIKNNNAFSFNQFLSSSAANTAGLLNFNPAALDPTNLQDSDFPNLDAPTTACPAPPACADPFASVNFFAPDRENGYTQQSSLEIQWEFYPQHSLSVGYVHTKGTSLPRNRNLNVLDQAFAIANARTFTFEDGSGNVIRTFDVPDYQANSTANRPDPNFSALNVNESGSSSFYNAMNVVFERRWHKGLVAGVTYTLSKNVTDISNGFSSSGSFFSDVFDQNNARLDRGLSRLDERHYFITRLVWEPEYWRDAEGAARWVLDGWSYGFIYNASSGRALTPVVDSDINRDNARTAFGDGDRVPFLARGSFETQGRNNFDLSVYKRFRFGEGKEFQFRFQAFNLFNRTFFTRFDDVLYNVSGTTATLNEDFLEPEGNARRNRDIQFGFVFRF